MGKSLSGFFAHFAGALSPGLAVSLLSVSLTTAEHSPRIIVPPNNSFCSPGVHNIQILGNITQKRKLSRRSRHVEVKWQILPGPFTPALEKPARIHEVSSNLLLRKPQFLLLQVFKI